MVNIIEEAGDLRRHARPGEAIDDCLAHRGDGEGRPDAGRAPPGDI